MSWSTGFASTAAGPIRAPVYLVRTLPSPGTPDVGVRYSSDRVSGYTECILVDQCSVSWGGLQMPSCQVSGSSCELAFSAAAASIDRVRQGVIVQVAIQLGSRIEPVYVGVLTGASMDYGGVLRWRLTGLETSLNGRYVTDGSESRVLFQGVGDKDGAIAGLDPGYTAGDITCDHTALTLLAGSTGLRCLKVTPNSGDPFYLVGTGDTGSQMTGCASGGALDTTLAAAAVGNEALPCAFDAGHPIDLFRAAVDPSVSDWPAEWRMNLPPEAVDGADMFSVLSEHRQYVASTFDRSIQVVTEAPVASLTEWISPILAPLGFFPRQRQGKLSVGFLHRPDRLTGLAVTDAQIVSASVEYWTDYRQAERVAVTDRSASPGHPVVPSDVTQEGPVGGDPWAALLYVHQLLGMDPPPPPIAGNAATAYTPGLGADIDEGHGMLTVPEHAARIPSYGGSPGVYGTVTWRARWRNDVEDRIGPWVRDRPEVLTVTLPGWLGYAIGDGLALDTRYLKSRYPSSASLRGGYGVIIGGGPDIFGTTTTYTVLSVPEGAPT